MKRVVRISSGELLIAGLRHVLSRPENLLKYVGEAAITYDPTADEDNRVGFEVALFDTEKAAREYLGGAEKEAAAG